jgi:flagellum-specific peptidoglycan hydrolase FlgJ
VRIWQKQKNEKGVDMYSQYTKNQVKSFVGQYGEIIIAGITDTGLFFPAVVGQLSMESRWGTSDLSAKYNNFGGIKKTGSSFSSGKVMMDTTEYVGGKRVPMKQEFATYATFKNFVGDYVRVLQLPHFVKAGVFTAADPYQQVLAMGKGGYSTADPQRYLEDCKGRIEACLDQFQWGKIETKAVLPTQAPDNSVYGVLQTAIKGIQETAIKTIKPAA